MIIDKNISLNITHRNVTYYNSKGYDVKIGNIIDVDIPDLHEGSIYKVNVKCDNCDKQTSMEYRKYVNNLKKYNKYFCNKCKHIKPKKTKFILYGDENYNNIERNKKTCLDRYGVDHYNKLDLSKTIIKSRKLQKYGDENYNNIETSPNYYYVVDDIRKNRFNFRKDVLVKQGFDPNKTEREIMLERKIYRIYDSGNLKFIFK